MIYPNVNKCRCTKFESVSLFLFTWFACYLWKPVPLLVQTIGTIYLFPWLPVFWSVCSNTFEVVYMKENHFGITYFICFLGISKIPGRYPMTSHLQSFFSLKQHSALSHQLTNHCLWILIMLLGVPATCLLTIFSNLFPCPLKFKLTSHEVLLNFFWISYAFLMNFLWISYAFLMNFLCISYEFLLNFLWISYEFLMHFFCIAYEFLMQFLCSSYAVLMQFLKLHTFFAKLHTFFQKKVWSFKNCIRTA